MQKTNCMSFLFLHNFRVRRGKNKPIPVDKMTKIVYNNEMNDV